MHGVRVSGAEQKATMAPERSTSAFPSARRFHSTPDGNASGYPLPRTRNRIPISPGENLYGTDVPSRFRELQKPSLTHAASLSSTDHPAQRAAAKQRGRLLSTALTHPSGRENEGAAKCQRGGEQTRSTGSP